MKKELDLKKFLVRQRVQSTSLLGLLSGRHTYFVDKMSQLIIRDSEDGDMTSADSELSDWEHDNMTFAKSIVLSKKKVD